MYLWGNVYRIIHISNPKINYIGSTFSNLRFRFTHHKNNFKQYLKNPIQSKNVSIYKYFEDYGLQNFKIILIKSYLVYAENKKDHTHLKAWEQLWINKFRMSKNCINKYNTNAYKPLQNLLHQETKKTYYEDNREHIKNKRKEHYVNNIQATLDTNKKWRDNNKNKIKAYNSKTYFCVACNKTLNLKKKPRHEQTNKHQTNLLKLQNITII
jgi:hypothetical protein